MEEMHYTKIKNKFMIIFTLLCVFLIFICCFIYFQIESPVKKYFILKKGYKIHVNFFTGKKSYKIGNNEFVYFENFKDGNSIDEPNLFGCSQVIISQRNKLLVIHYKPDIKEFVKIKQVLEDYLPKFDNEIPHVEFSFFKAHPYEKEFYEKNIKQILYKNFKNIDFHSTIFSTSDKHSSWVYNYSVTKTQNGLDISLSKRADILNILNNNYYFKNIKSGDRVAIELLDNDFAILLYQKNKIFVERYNTDCENNIFIKPLQKNRNKFNKNKSIQIVFIFPDNMEEWKSENLKKQILLELKPFKIKDISSLEYHNLSEEMAYSGFLRCGKIRGRIKRKQFGNILR